MLLFRYNHLIPVWNDALIKDKKTFKYEQNAKFFNFSMPSLQCLALQGIMEPAGAIDVATGKISLTLEMKPVFPFPDTLPYSPGKLSINDKKGDQSANFFRITWVFTCNGVKKECSSDEPCDIIMDCNDPINALNGWSSR